MRDGGPWAAAASPPVLGLDGGASRVASGEKGVEGPRDWVWENE